MARRAKTITKPERHERIQASRRRQVDAFRPHQLVEYPVPFPPVSHHEDDDGTFHELAVPTGDEEWHLAKVRELEHYEHTTNPDDYVALIQPLDRETREPFGIEQAISVVFLREPE